MLREVKPRNARTARILKQRDPKPVEDRKKTLLLHGPKCPLPLHAVLKTVHALTRPHSVLLNKKNENIHPFENVSSLEFLADKNECGLVVWGSSSKKRPNAVTILRMFDRKVLDMVELLLLPTTVGDTEGARLPLGVEMKPMILFAGSVWGDTSTSEVAQTYALVKSLFLDIFSGEEVSSIHVEGLQYLLMIAAGDSADDQYPRVHLRWYKIRTRRSGLKLPRVELDELKPKFDFGVGRRKEADSGVLKEAMKRGQRPDEDFKSKQKNVGMDNMGDKVGRVHLSRQDLGQLQLRKIKGLKRNAALSDEEEEEQQQQAEMGNEMELDKAPENEITKKPRIA